MRYLIKTLHEMQQLPRVNVTLWGGNDSRKAYLYFQQRHARYKLIRNKVWGVALLELPESFEDYLQGKSRELIRRKRKRALKEGYSFASFYPMDHFDDMLQINKSMATRQGRAIDKEYVDEAALKKFLADKSEMYGVFDKEGKLLAYTWLIKAGEVAIASRLLGHGDVLDKGVMYLMLSEIVREMISLRQAVSVPNWIMYDTFFGAADGLKFFKERLGFKPYKVNWRWQAAS